MLSSNRNLSLVRCDRTALRKPHVLRLLIGSLTSSSERLAEVDVSTLAALGENGYILVSLFLGCDCEDFLFQFKRLDRIEERLELDPLSILLVYIGIYHFANVLSSVRRHDKFHVFSGDLFGDLLSDCLLVFLNAFSGLLNRGYPARSYNT